jgi:hypothetical protein
MSKIKEWFKSLLTKQDVKVFAVDIIIVIGVFIASCTFLSMAPHAALSKFTYGTGGVVTVTSYAAALMTIKWTRGKAWWFRLCAFNGFFIMGVMYTLYLVAGYGDSHTPLSALGFNLCTELVILGFSYALKRIYEGAKSLKF